MQVQLAYGTEGLVVDVPEGASDVIVPRHARALADPDGALVAALRAPIAAKRLREIAEPGQRVAISVCDITRAQPREPVLRALLAELEGRTRRDDVTILIATGTHRANTAAELAHMLGDEIASTCRVVNHDARDASTLCDLGSIRGSGGDAVPVALNREWVEADLRITTGFVEPHFFAGWSGGPKMVAPGLAGLETVLVLHDFRRIAHPRATWGVVDGNPVQADIRAIAALPRARPHFALDVLLDHRQRITHVFTGELFAMHERAALIARETAMRAVPAHYDVVLTTNSGYPLDQNLYQAVKGMCAAAEVVEEGGTILCAAACADGLPSHGRYAELLGQASSMEELLARLEAAPETLPDQWQVQKQALVQRRAEVRVKSSGLTAEQLAAAHLAAVDDLEAAVGEALARHGPDARLCVLPEGPQTIPYVNRDDGAAPRTARA